MDLALIRSVVAGFVSRRPWYRCIQDDLEQEAALAVWAEFGGLEAPPAHVAARVRWTAADAGAEWYRVPVTPLVEGLDAAVPEEPRAEVLVAETVRRARDWRRLGYTVPEIGRRLGLGGIDVRRALRLAKEAM